MSGAQIGGGEERSSLLGSSFSRAGVFDVCNLGGVGSEVLGGKWREKVLGMS